HDVDGAAAGRIVLGRLLGQVELLQRPAGRRGRGRAGRGRRDDDASEVHVVGGGAAGAVRGGHLAWLGAGGEQGQAEDEAASRTEVRGEHGAEYGAKVLSRRRARARDSAGRGRARAGSGRGGRRTGGHGLGGGS